MLMNNTGYFDIYYENINFHDYYGQHIIPTPRYGYLMLSISAPYDNCGCKYMTVVYGKPYCSDTLMSDNEYLKSEIATKENDKANLNWKIDNYKRALTKFSTLW